MSKSKWVFEVETKESGQRRRYGDSYYHYIVESKHGVHIIKDFCTKLLNPAITQEKYKEEQPKDFCNNFTHYYTALDVLQEKKMLKDGVNIVEYKVVHPSTH